MNNPLKESSSQEVSPLSCLIGSFLAGILGYGLYVLTSSIIYSFYAKPLISSNLLTIKLGSLVRTLVMGVASLATFICFFISCGLILLAFQLFWNKINRT
ncbi:DUF3082 domain-containing protein [Candidatus Atelocyanobacterium thalassae]|uniref:DUF3082 domain-containing protein n=2 Tax=Candidatus Atelocyanobacterium thalassae TaxID=713887 RepID=A0A086CFS2_9CHRO|nr:DUF3082 domain-containing protein [Candidatus Atelocyanobacterium thalassa]KFF41036.1 MAG: Protein of unknown function (DUF3082) [Candidatus Atelocyanobacterium thalassa isolate SIO64986]BDA40011.1 hypothetical protein CPARK_000085100 [cyanobacterium endosymbiont of Braarudosphaera bigelowii]